MGRIKKKPPKAWCWYCNREFDDEKILIQHQRAKHFKCHLCYKRLFTGPVLASHCLMVHKETLEKVPNALPNRCSVDIEINGMEGIPEEDLRVYELQKQEASHKASSSSQDKRSVNSSAASAKASSKIMHPDPDEDLTLEEIRAQLPRYQGSGTMMGNDIPIDNEPISNAHCQCQCHGNTGMVPGTSSVLMNPMPPMMRQQVNMLTGLHEAMYRMNALFPRPAGPAVYSQGPSLLPHMMGQRAPRPF